MSYVLLLVVSLKSACAADSPRLKVDQLNLSSGRAVLSLDDLAPLVINFRSVADYMEQISQLKDIVDFIYDFKLLAVEQLNTGAVKLPQERVESILGHLAAASDSLRGSRIERVHKERNLNEDWRLSRLDVVSRFSYQAFNQFFTACERSAQRQVFPQLVQALFRFHPELRRQFVAIRHRVYYKSKFADVSRELQMTRGQILKDEFHLLISMGFGVLRSTRRQALHRDFVMAQALHELMLYLGAPLHPSCDPLFAARRERSA